MIGKLFGWVDGRVYYRCLSTAFDREMAAVQGGMAVYRQHQASGTNRYQLVRNVHMIEKGLTMRPRRETFAAGYIEQTVQAWRSHGPSLGEEEAGWVRDVLAAYFAATASSPDPAVVRARQAMLEAGSVVPPPHELTPSSGPDRPATRAGVVDVEALRQLAVNRRSVRWFLPESVPREVVDTAMTVAREAPTACNRQPYRFVVVDDADVLDVASIPMGTQGYAEQLQSVIVVVGDWSAYFDERDRHLPYIDGSLAAMSLVLGLEAQGVSTCCINWPDIRSRDAAMARVLGLPAHERVVMLIAYGYADPEGEVPFSGKRQLDAVRQFRRSEARVGAIDGGVR
ncbi:nitroreductase family protein [Cellulomonas bogoriensis]|uniref:NADH dehydrogenase n=2 Tax=Cellulomonas bogoriensis TaxID=301388 RepID=A0A0A0BTG3_9CELL|nr:NADH dehydrogenase [Cellulomonas bogoriensis 69B4 = DSM 16987]